VSDQLPFYDCNVSIGRPPNGVYRACPSADELLREMDWAGIDRALVRHDLMSSQSPVVGNKALSEAIAAHPRLSGSWAILPPQTKELPQGDAFFEAMSDANIKALWAFPEEHRYMLRRIVFGEFLDELADRRVPLFLCRPPSASSNLDRYRLIYDLLSECPGLTVVAVGFGPWGDDRFFRPLVEAYPRFYYDISRYELDCGLREYVNAYGAERLLYGSNFPVNSMGGPRMMVACAGIDDDARALVAGGNLARLLGEVQL